MFHQSHDGPTFSFHMLVTVVVLSFNKHHQATLKRDIPCLPTAIYPALSVVWNVPG